MMERDCDHMLEKLPSKPFIHKLCVIHIIEYNLNLLIGIMWGRRLMHQAEKLQALGRENARGRANHGCYNILMFKQLFNMATKMDASSFDNDATACYNCIVMHLALLLLQRLGLEPKICALFIKTLQTYRIPNENKIWYHH